MLASAHRSFLLFPPLQCFAGERNQVVWTSQSQDIDCRKSRVVKVGLKNSPAIPDVGWRPKLAVNYVERPESFKPDTLGVFPLCLERGRHRLPQHNSLPPVVDFTISVTERNRSRGTRASFPQRIQKRPVSKTKHPGTNPGQGEGRA